MADNNVPISAAEDGAMYRAFAHNIDFVIGQYSSGKMRLNYTSASLSVTLSAGEAIVCGRHVVNTGTITLTLPANSSGYICLRINGTVSPETVSLVSATQTYPDTDINVSNTQHDFVIGQYTTNSNGVSSYVDTALRRESVFATASGNPLKNGLGNTRQTLYLSSDLVFQTGDLIPKVTLLTQQGGGHVPPTGYGEYGDIQIIRYANTVYIYRCTSSGTNNWSLFCQFAVS